MRQADGIIAQATPGPWQLRGIRNAEGWMRYDLHEYRAPTNAEHGDSLCGPCFAEVRFEGGNHEQDARLMAAAPELRDALKWAMAALDAAGWAALDDYHPRLGDDEDRTIAAGHDVASALLARLEGR